jgi:hypothetical protein
VAQLQGAVVTLVGLPADATRLGIAKKAYGFRTFDGDVRELKGEGDGLGAQLVIDAAGVSASLKTALELVRPAGWITKVGWGPQPLGFSLDPLVQKNVTLQGSYSHNWPVWNRVLQLLATRQLVIDAPAGASGLLLQELLARTHCILIPVAPSPIDIHATANFIRDLLLAGRIRNSNIRLAVVANRVRKAGAVYQPLERFLASLNLPLLARLGDSETFAFSSFAMPR